MPAVDVDDGGGDGGGVGDDDGGDGGGSDDGDDDDGCGSGEDAYHDTRLCDAMPKLTCWCSSRAAAARAAVGESFAPRTSREFCFWRIGALGVQGINESRMNHCGRKQHSLHTNNNKIMYDTNNKIICNIINCCRRHTQHPKHTYRSRYQSSQARRLSSHTLMQQGQQQRAAAM
jgi:hypothetical protein